MQWRLTYWRISIWNWYMLISVCSYIYYVHMRVCVVHIAIDAAHIYYKRRWLYRSIFGFFCVVSGGLLYSSVCWCIRRHPLGWNAIYWAEWNAPWGIGLCPLSGSANRNTKRWRHERTRGRLYRGRDGVSISIGWRRGLTWKASLITIEFLSSRGH